MSDFKLDDRLAADTVFIGNYFLCEIRLMNDSRWPWLILVPGITGAEEIHDLTQYEQAQISTETALAASAIKSLTTCTKINTAAIGNIVRQLHIHVIARNQGDANWPGPVWGYGVREEYGEQALRETVESAQKALAVNAGFSGQVIKG